MGLVLAAADASLARADEEPLPAFSYGSRGLGALDAQLGLWRSEIKKRSHFGFQGDGSRSSEIQLVNDLGLSDVAFAPDVRLDVGFGPAGWVGVDATGFVLDDEQSVLRIDRIARGVRLEPGDLVRSSAWVALGQFRFGYDLGLDFTRVGFPLALTLSPTANLGFYILHVNLKRLAPDPITGLGGRAVGWTLAPGVEARAVFFEHLVVGADFAMALRDLANHLSFSNSRVTLWERARVYAGARFERFELTAGWRLSATHLVGRSASADMRLRGFDVALGVGF
jgi:hypothetical protein